jgi:signal transduction histidine kinase
MLKHWPAPVRRLLSAIPPEPPAPPITYSLALVGYVVAICVLAVVVASLTLQRPSDVTTLIVGAIAIALLVLVMVRSFGGVQSAWSPTAFVHLALSLTVGPAGALTAAVVDGVASGWRLRVGWLRAVFNAADFLVANLAALTVFRWAEHVSNNRTWIIFVGGAAAGSLCYVVNYGLLGLARRISSGASLHRFFADTLEVIPFDIGYGIAAAGLSLSAADGSASVFASWLIPIVSAQAFLVLLARRTNAHEEDTARHARERMELLERNITAEEDHRAKSAADLHDGPVAALAGLTMELGSIADKVAPEARETLHAVIEELTQTNRDLRTHIFDLSPHDLDQPGRLRDELATKQRALLASHNVETKLDVPNTIPLDQAGLELVHRVCREALTNIQRHAHASRVSLAVSLTDDLVIVEIDDDGRGFSSEDVARQRADGHFGMRFLKEKAEVAHGSLLIDSTPGTGSRVELRLPASPQQGSESAGQDHVT